MRGEAGCNSFGGDFMYSQGALDTREVIAESAGCSPERLMEAELAFTDLIWGDDRIQVSFSGDTMTWRAGEDILKFVAVDTEPVAPTLPPQTSFGPLDCGDAVVVRDTVPASGSDFDSFAVEGRSLIEGIEDVSSIEQLEPNSLVWFGNDNEGATVAAVAFDDMQPATFSIYTCP
jgi:hypothetical protein